MYNSFINEFDVWLAVFSGLVLVVCLFGIRYLFKNASTDEVDAHEEMLWRILDKGDKQ